MRSHRVSVWLPVMAGLICLTGYAMVSVAAEYTPEQKERVTTIPQDPVVVEIEVIYEVEGESEEPDIEIFSTAFITNRQEMPREVILRAISTAGDTLYIESFGG